MVSGFSPRRRCYSHRGTLGILLIEAGGSSGHRTLSITRAVSGQPLLRRISPTESQERVAAWRSAGAWGGAPFGVHALHAGIIWISCWLMPDRGVRVPRPCVSVSWPRRHCRSVPQARDRKGRDVVLSPPVGAVGGDRLPGMATFIVTPVGNRRKYPTRASSDLIGGTLAFLGSPPIPGRWEAARRRVSRRRCACSGSCSVRFFCYGS